MSGEIDTRFMDRRQPADCIFHGEFSTKTFRDVSGFNQSPSAIGSGVTISKVNGIPYGETSGGNHASNSISFADIDRYSFIEGGSQCPFSIWSWVYCDGFTLGERVSTIISKTITYSAGFEWRFTAGVGSGNGYGYVQAPQLFLADISQVKNINVYRTDGNITTSEWHLLCVTYDGTTATANGLNMYLDGNLVNMTRSKQGVYVGMTNSSGVLRMFAVASGQVMDGKISNVIILKNRILTSSEILQLYSDGPAQH